MSTSLPQIPLPYRLLFLTLEPLMALCGALICHLNTHAFLATMSRTAVFTPDTQVIYDQLAATYFLFAFNQAIVLRVSEDLRVWKAILFGILICDVLHLAASWREMGTSMFWNPWEWRWEDWSALATIWVPGLLRLGFLREIGFEGAEHREKTGIEQGQGKYSRGRRCDSAEMTLKSPIYIKDQAACVKKAG